MGQRNPAPPKGWFFKPIKIMGCLPPFSNGASPNHDRYMVYKCLLDGYYFWWCPLSNIPKSWDIYQPLSQKRFFGAARSLKPWRKNAPYPATPSWQTWRCPSPGLSWAAGPLSYSWWTNILLWKITMLLMGKSTISMAIFSCFLYVHQRV